jgi:hypothetical protein
MSSTPSLEYLVTSSKAALENFGLARMNAIANLRKELRDVVEEWIEAETQSRLARWVLECRRIQESSAGAETSELPRILPAEDSAANLPPASCEPPQARESQSPAATPLSIDSSRSPRDSTPSPDALPLLRRKLSRKAKEALTFLEQHGRLQTDAIGTRLYKPAAETDRLGALSGSDQPAVQHRRSHTDAIAMGLHKPAAETDRLDAFSGSDQHAVQDRRLSRSSRTAPPFPTLPDTCQQSGPARAPTRRHDSGPPTKTRPQKASTFAASPNPAGVAQIVPLVRREKLPRPLSVRYSLRYCPAQRKAV